MKRKTQQFLSLTAAGLVLVAGCAVGPQTRPTPNAPGNTAGAAGSTTGDMDACAVALGNMVAGAGTTTGTTVGTNKGTAAGVPSPATVSTPGAPDATGTAATGVGGTTAPGTVPGTTATTPAGTPGTPGAAGTTGAGTGVEVTANGVLLGNVALVALPTQDNMGTTGANTGIGPVGVTGAGNTTGAGGTMGSAPGAAGTDVFRGNTTAVEKIRTACTQVTEVRVVNSPADRTRLAEIAMAIRKGTPITAHLDEISAMSRRATTAWSGPAGGAGTTGTAP